VRVGSGEPPSDKVHKGITVTAVSAASYPLFVVGVIAAFILGSRWRHHRRSRTDHRAALVQARKAQTVKRLALVGLVGAVTVNVLFYCGLIASAKDNKQVGPPTPTISPATGGSSHPAGRPHSPSARPSPGR
jgi:hypothetical protein